MIVYLENKETFYLKKKSFVDNSKILVGLYIKIFKHVLSITFINYFRYFPHIFLAEKLNIFNNIKS